MTENDPGKLGDSLREGETITVTKPPRKRAPTKKTAPKTPAVEAPAYAWDRQPKESGPAWEAFVTYRDLGLTRSITKVADRVGKSRGLIGRWSKAHTWPLRAIAYDRFCDREWQLEMTEARSAANKRNARIAKRAMDKVEAAIDFLAFEDVGELARLMDIATKIEARALGMSTENVQLTGKNGGPVEVADMSKLSDEDRRARMQQLIAEAQKRIDEQGREAEAG